MPTSVKRLSFGEWLCLQSSPSLASSAASPEDGAPSPASTSELRSATKDRSTFRLVSTLSDCRCVLIKQRVSVSVSLRVETLVQPSCIVAALHELRLPCVQGGKKKYSGQQGPAGNSADALASFWSPRTAAEYLFGAGADCLKVVHNPKITVEGPDTPSPACH